MTGPAPVWPAARVYRQTGLPAQLVHGLDDPWATFEGFNLNLQDSYRYLLPIFTLGKYREENGRTWLPLAMQVHHAVCDGYHACRFAEELQAWIGP